MARTTTPLQDEIAQFLSEHPLSSAKDVCEGIGTYPGRGKSTISVALLKMYQNRRATREQDEEGVYRYVLKASHPQNELIDAEKDLGIEHQIENDSRNRAIEVANGFFRLRHLMDGILSYIASHPNSSAEEIAKALNFDYYDVGGALIYAWSPDKIVGLDRAVDEEGVLRYTYTPCAPTTEETRKLVKVKTLDDFTPREMFAHLKNLGYKWSAKALYHEKVTVERNFVDFDKI